MICLSNFLFLIDFRSILFVTIVEIHTLIIDVCVCLKERLNLSEQLLGNTLD